jgi:protein-tyrosine phosphatase
MRTETTSLAISQITDYLYISAWPRGNHIEQIVALGVNLVLSMHLLPPVKLLGHARFRVLWLPTFDNPRFPISLKTLTKGVKAALPTIQDGQAVLTHCKEGKHRSVAQAACVLIGMDYTADDAMQLIKEKRAVADPYAEYIQVRIKKFESQWFELKNRSKEINANLSKEQEGHLREDFGAD